MSIYVSLTPRQQAQGRGGQERNVVVEGRSRPWGLHFQC